MSARVKLCSRDPAWQRVLRPYDRDAQRDRDIAAKLDRGMTFQAVGNQYGISRQRVHQIRQRLEREGMQ
jgi:DNA-directed RNA polymerase sigma subunit (sigma70/sigma32)